MLEIKLPDGRYTIEIEYREGVYGIMPIRYPATVNGHGINPSFYPVWWQGSPLTPDRVVEMNPTERNRKYGLTHPQTAQMPKEIIEGLSKEWVNYPEIPDGYKGLPSSNLRVGGSRLLDALLRGDPHTVLLEMLYENS